MMRKSQDGFIEEFGLVLIIVLVVGFFISIFFTAFFVRFQASQSVVSGIVYNTETNHAVSGKTTFSVRASVDTYVYHDQNGNTNESSFCLPPHSPYEALIEKAAADKNIKVVVTAHKYFAIQSPFTCQPNVTVTEEKK
jgi:hypothetical protein